MRQQLRRRRAAAPMVTMTSKAKAAALVALLVLVTVARGAANSVGIAREDGGDIRRRFTTSTTTASTWPRRRRRDSETAEESIDERQALLKFYNETSGRQWLKSNGWGTDADYCTWYGVVCATSSSSSSQGDSSQPRVIEIQLPNNNVARNVAALWKLPRLRRVNLRSNPIDDLGLATTANGSAELVLEALDVSDCLLSSISGLGQRTLSSLQELRMSGNVGLANTNPNPISALLSSLSNLEVLDASSCSLQGSLPSLESASSSSLVLRELYLSNNRIRGSIPSTIDRLSNLQVLDLSTNQLTGPLPTQLDNLKHLQALDLSYQQSSTADGSESPSQGLTGPLLSFASAPYLSKLALSHNQFTGTLPSNLLESYRPLASVGSSHDDDAIKNADDGDSEEQQVTIDVSFNNLNGTMPETFATRFDRLDLNVVGNPLEGPVPDSYCAQLNWMQGTVGTMGCDAIACPLGTYAPDVGRATPGDTTDDPSSCHECAANTMYIGATACGSENSVLLTEPEILLQLYNATGGSDGAWTKSDGWDGLVALVVPPTLNETAANSSSASSLCRLYGIHCNSHGQVTTISLANNGLVGTLPSSLFQLPDLVSLDLSDNLIEVERWTGLERASSLTRLKVSRTRITTLRHISQASELAELAADGNDVRGPIPTDLFRLTNLFELRLEASFLTGTIPPALSQLTKLKKLHLNENHFTGQLPSELAQLSLLEELDLSNLQLNGTLPTEWNSLQRLVTLRINGDQREGGVGGPLLSFSGLDRIETLDLSHNNLEGPIPDRFLSGRSRSGSLRIDLHLNRLSGSIPTTLGTFERLFIDLSDNQISSLSEDLCQDGDWMEGETALVPDNCNAILCRPGTWSELGRASSKANVWCDPCENATYFGSTSCSSNAVKPSREAEILDLLYISTGGPWWRKPHFNWTKPYIPICHREGVRCAGSDPNSGVVELYLNEFGMRGQIPDEIFELPQLRLLGVSFNNVDLSLKNIGKAKKLQSLLASATNVRSLSGIENAGDTLMEIHLAKNGIKGKFPSEVLYLDSLRELFINENKFSGTIPSEVSHMKSLQRLSLEENRFVGFLPTELGFLSDLTHINVQGNLLSGLIPQSFSKLHKLVDVNLSNQKSVRKFTGPVSSFETNEALTHIDLSGNAFAGALPESFLAAVDKASTIYANLSRNDVQGSVPESFDAFQRLDLDLAANSISYLPKLLCDNSEWMSGMVGNVHSDEACNAILCPPGTFAPQGRQLHANSPCMPCAEKDEAPYYGSTSCDNTPITASCVVEVVNGSAACSDVLTERGVLENLFSSTWGGGWTNNTGWMTDQPICSWKGVICVGEPTDDTGVLAINLISNGLVGPLPPALWTLPELRHVAVSSNPDLVISLGDIPTTTMVESLILHETHVMGLEAMPTSLPVRELSFSCLTGTFPIQLLKLRNLERLDLDDNHFAGTFPTDWSKAKRLKVLSARGNDFHGTVPSSLFRIKTLEELALDDNLLSGALPLDAIASSSSLRSLSIARDEKSSGRKLHGPLPSFVSARALESVSFAGNDLTGTIPADFVSATAARNLLLVDLSNNQLTGTVPSRLVKDLSSLNLQIAGNHFDNFPVSSCVDTGSSNESSTTIDTCSNVQLCEPGAWSPSGRFGNATLEACTKCPVNETSVHYGSTSCQSRWDDRTILTALFHACDGSTWYRNGLWTSPAHVCDWHGVGCNSEGNVVLVSLPNNNLRCELPPSLLGLVHLEKLDVSSNPITMDFQKLSHSQQSKLSELRMSNTLASSLSGVEHLTSLVVLDVSYSKLQGRFPDTVATNLPNLRVLDLSGNQFSGVLVTTPWDEGSTYFMNEALQRYSVLRVLKLDGNQFSGSIPSIQGSETMIHLSLSKNQFNGTIPHDLLSRVSVLRPPEVSKPTTAIPPGFAASSLTIDVSDNDLTGKIPEELFSRFANIKLKLLVAGNRVIKSSGSQCETSSMNPGLSQWNDGDLGKFGCDGLVCPEGTYHATGRSSAQWGPCRPCPSPTPGSPPINSYVGQRTCPGATTGSLSSAAYYYHQGGQHPTVAIGSLVMVALVVAWTTTTASMI